MHSMTATTAAAIALLSGCASPAGATRGAAVQQAQRGGGEHEEEISPGEDLMREHGVLRRLLLLYDDGAARLEAGTPVRFTVLEKSAELIRHFVEDYHERTEEEMVFPRFAAAGRDADLVRTLREQHDAGRALTAEIVRLAHRGGVSEATALAHLLRSFCRMYRPHAAREDTVLFPAFNELASEVELKKLGQRFEEREHQLFGEDGFSRVVSDVAALEQAVGLYELGQFTP
jgi:hemerythrin-like domain-containing protein